VDEINSKKVIITYWLEMAEQSLQSAASELESGRYHFAVNRLYYAYFYSASAVLLQSGHRFTKHSGVRGALHSHLVKTGKLDKEWGKFFDIVFENRQRGDYTEFITFEKEQVRYLLEKSKSFVQELQRLLGANIQEEDDRINTSV
jgi:uncharacterized protein (UPF0332 family)